MDLSVSSPYIYAEEDELSHFGHDIAIQVIHEFTGIVLDTAKSEENDRGFEGAILTLALLDASIATALTCLRDHGSDSVWGHWQKLYLDTFTTFQPLLYNQLVGVVRQFVTEWFPTDVSLDAQSGNSNIAPKDPLIAWKGTIEIYLPVMQRLFISVAWN